MRTLLFVTLFILVQFTMVGQSCTHSYTLNPFMPMHAIVTEIRSNNYVLQSGDIIAVYDHDLCVGYTKINLNTDYHVIILYADDPSTPILDGYTVGNELIFRYCPVISITSGVLTRSHYQSGDQMFTMLGTWVGGIRIR